MTGAASRRSGGWWRELLLGARMALAGGPSGWIRAGLTAVGVGLGVAMLLAAVSIPQAMDAREQRTSGRDDMSFGDEPSRSDTTVLVGRADTVFGDERIRGRLLQPDGSRPPIPPGLTAVPAAGQMIVSPALRDLLTEPDSALLRERLDYPIAGIIADSGLAGPNELAFYLGATELDQTSEAVERRAAFGEPASSASFDPVLSLIVVVIVVVLLLPVAMFVAAAVRFGAEARDRRLAGVRLVGADARMARRIAAGEALTSSALGLALGSVMFVIGRSLVARFEIVGTSMFPSDLRPDLVLAALTFLAVPTAAVGVTLLSLRRVMIEPLGVARRAEGRRRRLWWRLLFPVAGALVLVPLLGDASMRGGGVDAVQVSVGLCFILVGVAALLPWLVEAATRRVRGGPVAWQLAIRRLQLDPSTSARAVMGIAVAVAGAVGLQTLFVSVEANYRHDTGADPGRADLVTYVALDGDWDDVQAVEATLRATAGVRAVHSRVWVGVSFPPAPGSPEEGFGDLGSLLTIADCAGLREIAEIDSCGEGDVFITEPSADNNWGQVPRPGTVLTLDAWPGDPAQPGSGEWAVPDTARVVTARTDPVGGSQFGVLATPSAFPAAHLASRSRQFSSFVDMDQSDPMVVENVRNVLWAQHPTNSSYALVATGESANFVAVRRGLLGGAIVTLILIGVSLLVSVLEQLRERRRVLAGLVAFGTRRRTLALSILWQTVVPVALGMVLAVGTGVAVGAILLAIANESISVDWASVGLMVGVAASVVVAVTALSMPVLWRVMRADGLHTE